MKPASPAHIRWLQTAPDHYTVNQWKKLQQSELAPILPWISARFLNFLINSGTLSFKDLLTVPHSELFRYPGLGRQTVAEIEAMRSFLEDQLRAIEN